MGKKTFEKAGDNLREFKVGDRVKVDMPYETTRQCRLNC